MPWNYPFHNIFNPLMAAVFAGSGIVIKVPPSVPTLHQLSTSLPCAPHLPCSTTLRSMAACRCQSMHRGRRFSMAPS